MRRIESSEDRLQVIGQEAALRSPDGGQQCQRVVLQLTSGAFVYDQACQAAPESRQVVRREYSIEGDASCISSSRLILRRTPDLRAPTTDTAGQRTQMEVRIDRTPPMALTDDVDLDWTVW